MPLPVHGVILGERRILNDEQVLRVVVLCRLGEVQAARQSPWGDGVLCVDVRGNAGALHEKSLRAGLRQG